jgi:hypothetical protein
MDDRDLSGAYMQERDPEALVMMAWESSTKNAAAAGYIAGLIDGLRHQGAITVAQYNRLLNRTVYGGS